LPEIASPYSLSGKSTIKTLDNNKHKMQTIIVCTKITLMKISGTQLAQYGRCDRTGSNYFTAALCPHSVVDA